MNMNMNNVHLWKTFLKFSIGNLTAYRTDLLLRGIGMLLNVGLMIVILVLPYKYADDIAGWKQHELIIAMGMYFLMNGLCWALFKDGIFRIEDKIKYGLMDTVLLKPVNSIFMTSFFEIDVTRFADALVGGVIIVHQIVTHGVEVDLVRIVAFAASCVFGLVIVFALYLSANTLSFWTTEAYIGHVSNPIFTVAKYPIDLWGVRIEKLLLWVLPIGFMAYVPTALLLGKLPVWWAGIAGIVALGWVAGSRVLWGIALKNYSGTGS